MFHFLFYPYQVPYLVLVVLLYFLFMVYLGIAIRKTGSGNLADRASLNVYRIQREFAGFDHRIR